MFLADLQSKLIAGGACVAFVIFAYIFGFNKGESTMDTYWRVKIATTPVKYDTLRIVEYKTIESKVETVFAYKKIQTKSPKIDSGFAKERAQLITENIQYQNEIIALKQPASTVTKHDSIGQVAITYFADEGKFICEWSLLPQKTEVRTIIGTQIIIEPRAWYEIPAVVLITGAATYGIIEILK